MIIYKVEELTIVTDKDIEKVINHWVKQGWSLDGIHFVTKEGMHRPTMAFILFIKEEKEAVED